MELVRLCDKHRGCNGDSYDCIIPVSGGKDSYYQVYTLKKRMNMNPLLLHVGDLFTTTKAGEHNLKNLTEAFGCDLITLHLNPAVAKKMMRKAFEEMGSPTWCYDRAIYAWPLQMGIKLGIQLIIWGENTSFEYGGPLLEETPSALDQLENDAVKDVGGLEYWVGDSVTTKDLNPYTYPTADEIEKAKLNPVYLSYFEPWSGRENMWMATDYGFKTLKGEWEREGFFEDYDQIDSIGYLVHPQLKYPKFGHARVSDVCSIWVREGRMTRSAAIEMVRDHDHKMDPRAIDDFCNFTGYTKEEFRNIVDKWYNRNLFRKVKSEWKLKNQIE